MPIASKWLTISQLKSSSSFWLRLKIASLTTSPSASSILKSSAVQRPDSSPSILERIWNSRPPISDTAGTYAGSSVSTAAVLSTAAPVVSTGCVVSLPPQAAIDAVRRSAARQRLRVRFIGKISFSDNRLLAEFHVKFYVYYILL